MEPKTIKAMFQHYYERLLAIYPEYGAKVDEVVTNNMLSYEGKKAKVAAIREDLWAYLERIENKAKSRVREVVDRINQEEAAELAAKSNNPEYAALLANTLAILPMAVQSGNMEALMDRLKPFNNDPVAITAITNILKPTSEKEAKERNSLFVTSIIPEDNRGKRQETILKILNTFISQTNQVYERMSLDSGNSHDQALPASLQSSLDYVNLCNDDCTVYDQAAGWEHERAQVAVGEDAGIIDFGFKGVRPRK